MARKSWSLGRRSRQIKITFITNACAIYETDGFKLLSDPWLTEPAFGSWVHDPPIKTKPEDVTDVDMIYISHIHQDHCDPETLKHFRRDIDILCLKDRFTKRHLQNMGFTHVSAIEDNHGMLFGKRGMVVLFGPFCKHPYHECEVGNVIDSALMIDDDRKTVLNCADNTPDEASAEEYLRQYGSPDLLQINYNNAGPYPACFRNLSHKEKIAEAKRCVERNLAHMAEIASILNPRYVMPFAGAYKLGYGKEHLNQYLGTCSADDAANYLELKGFRPVVLAEGESFELD